MLNCIVVLKSVCSAFEIVKRFLVASKLNTAPEVTGREVLIVKGHKSYFEL